MISDWFDNSQPCLLALMYPNHFTQPYSQLRLEIKPNKISKVQWVAEDWIEDHLYLYFFNQILTRENDFIEYSFNLSK